MILSPRGHFECCASMEDIPVVWRRADVDELDGSEKE